MSESQAPLTAAMFNVLITLADGEKHGYAILKEVEEQTAGEVSSAPARSTASSSGCWPRADRGIAPQAGGGRRPAAPLLPPDREGRAGGGGRGHADGESCWRGRAASGC